jgi:hypothetical protein
VKAGSGSALKSTFRSFRGSKLSPEESRTLTMEAWRLKMEPLRACITGVADLLNFGEEEDPDPDLIQNTDPP